MSRIGILSAQRDEEQSKGFEAHIQIFMMLLTLVLFSWWLLTAFVVDKDVRIFVNDDLTQAEHQRLAQRLTGKKSPAALRNELAKLAWVADVTIRKNGQGDLLLSVRAEDLVAYLPGKGYYLSNGEFMKTRLNEKRKIPVIKHTAAISNIEKPARILPALAEVLSKQHLVPKEYRIGSGGDLRVTLQNGPDLIFGYRSHTARLKLAEQFLTKHKKELRNIKHIDLRYDNALAINRKNSRR